MANVTFQPMRYDYYTPKPLPMSFCPPKTIVLIGLMGAGKTSIGRRLAKRLDLQFFDSDHEVEAAAGFPIKEILSIYGEEAFRSGEQRVISRLLDQPVHVLATGGTSFTNEQTQAEIKEKAISVWLKADLPTLVARVSRRSDRPFLNGNNHEEILSQLIDERYPVYELADVSVETFDEPTGATVERVVQAITDFIKTKHPTEFILKAP